MLKGAVGLVKLGARGSRRRFRVARAPDGAHLNREK